MKDFITLTPLNEEDHKLLYINSQVICHIEEHDNKTILSVFGGKEFRVKETAKEILNLIKKNKGYI